jgi:succinyl-diaminopimelate desuccinylase
VKTTNHLLNIRITKIHISKKEQVMLNKITVKINHLIDQQKKELNKLLCDLIQAKSENPPGDVSSAAHVIENFLKHAGISFESYEPVEGHASVVATVGKGKPSLILCGHIDVVPAGDVSRWDMNPYEGAMKGDNVFGRGASDQKGGVAAMLMASVVTKDFEDKLPGKVTVACVSDEEAKGPGGAHWLLENEKISGNSCLITEPTGYLDGPYAITAGERGNFWLRLKAHGHPAHASKPALGKNAIDLLTECVKMLKYLETEAVKTPKDAETLVRNGKKQLKKVAGQHCVSSSSLTRTLDHYTTSLGLIHGGTKVNIVPEYCEGEVDIRIPAGGNPKGVEKFVRNFLPKDVEFEAVNVTLPSFTPAHHQLTKAVQQSAKEIFGYKPSANYMAATSDAHYFRELLGVPTVSFGPGYEEIIHTYNEFVRVKDVLNMAKTYANIIVNYSL